MISLVIHILQGNSYFREGEIEYLGRGTDWSIGKARERLESDSVKDQDEISTKVDAYEAKRPFIQ